MQTPGDSESSSRKREENLSSDGKWRSFPKVPHLLQYVTNGNYYGRIKIDGKIIRESLKTAVWTTAKLRLVDFLKEHHENRSKIDPPLFSEAVELYKIEVEHDTTTKKRTKEYRHRCLDKIQKMWPELWELRLDAITPEACREWAAKLNKAVAPQYFNNLLDTFRGVLSAGLKAHKTNGGRPIENPATELKRARIKQTELRLPEPSQFKELIASLRKKSGGWGPRVADLAEFLAYGGMRIHSEAMWVTWEDIDWKRKEIIVRGNPETGTKNSEMRRVPILPDMEKLLLRLKENLGTISNERIVQVVHCREALARACKDLGIARLTHHDLRHLFATRCIESGVDIPTVSRWLGHKDGGALAMRTYGHLRNEHSQAMAQKVKF